MTKNVRAMAYFLYVCHTSIALYRPLFAGDAMRMATQFWQLQLSPDCLPEALQGAIVRAVEETLHQWNAAPEEDRVGELPQSLQAESMTWTATWAVSSKLPDSAPYGNMFFHGWLFADTVTPPSPLGANRWPLCGLYDAVGIRGYEDASLVGAAAAAPENSLRPADQHIHRVDPSDEMLALDAMGLSEEDRAAICSALGEASWHIGSDSARIRTDAASPTVGVGWAVAVDLSGEQPRTLVTLMWVIPAHLEVRCMPLNREKVYKEDLDPFRLWSPAESSNGWVFRARQESARSLAAWAQSRANGWQALAEACCAGTLPEECPPDGRALLESVPEEERARLRSLILPPRD